MQQELYNSILVIEHKAIEAIPGPLYLLYIGLNDSRRLKHQLILGNRVATPDHFFKTVRANDRIFAWILLNQAIDKDTFLTEFEVTIQKVERASEIIFNFNR